MYSRVPFRKDPPYIMIYIITNITFIINNFRFSVIQINSAFQWHNDPLPYLHLCWQISQNEAWIKWYLWVGIFSVVGLPTWIDCSSFDYSRSQRLFAFAEIPHRQVLWWSPAKGQSLSTKEKSKCSKEVLLILRVTGAWANVPPEWQNAIQIINIQELVLTILASVIYLI